MFDLSPIKAMSQSELDRLKYTKPADIDLTFSLLFRLLETIDQRDARIAKLEAAMQEARDILGDAHTDEAHPRHLPPEPSDECFACIVQGVLGDAVDALEAKEAGNA